MRVRDQSSKRTQPSSFADWVIALAVTALGLANLALPESMQEVFGVDYLIVIIAALGAMVILRLNISIRRGACWGFATLLVLSASPGFLVATINEYGMQKLQTVIIIAICLIAVASIVTPSQGAAIFLAGAGALSLIFSALMFTVSVTAVNGRVSVLDLNPVGVARLTALGITIPLVYLIAVRRATVWKNLLTVLLVLFCGAATLLTGSRGPLVAAVGAVLICLLAALVVRGANIVVLMLPAVAIPAAINFGNIDLGQSLAWSSGRQDSGRFNLYADALGQISEYPLGIGWGNFGQLYGWTSGAIYPHNIFLEIGAEGGLVALIAFITAMLVSFTWAVANYRLSRSSTDLLLLAVYSYALINAQFSSDLVGNRMLWAAMAFVVATRAASRQRGARSGRRFARKLAPSA